MKKLAIRKTAGLLALIMTISMLLPIIAYAGVTFVKGTYNPNTGKVTATVYLTEDVYQGLGKPAKVAIQVYNNNDVIGYVYAEYKRTADGYYYYEVNVTDAAYKRKNNVRFNVYYPDDTVAATFKPTVVDNSSYPGPFIPPVTDGDEGEIVANPDGSVDADALKKALESGFATIEISGEVAKLPASALTGGGVVTIVSELGSYELPLDELNLEALAEELGVSLDELVIVVTIAELKGAAKEEAEAAIESTGATAVSAIVDFKVEAVSGGKTLYEFKKFGKFLKRTLNLTGEGDNLVGVRITGNSVNPVPTQVGDDDAAIFSNSNSVYAIIDVAPKSFADLRNHWAEKDITTLANKLIVNGTGADKFEPKRDVTRAEFAALIVRALGLQASEAADFSDVPASAWYADAVAAAAEYGIVKGDGTGKFRPTDKITRQELAAMVVRAQALAGIEIDLSSAEVAALLAGFKDAGQIGSWARAELAAAIESGIVNGTSANTVSPTATATRAEAAAMIIRLLDNAEFI